MKVTSTKRSEKAYTKNKIAYCAFFRSSFQTRRVLFSKATFCLRKKGKNDALLPADRTRSRGGVRFFLLLCQSRRRRRQPDCHDGDAHVVGIVGLVPGARLVRGLGLVHRRRHGDAAHAAEGGERRQSRRLVREPGRLHVPQRQRQE